MGNIAAAFRPVKLLSFFFLGLFFLVAADASEVTTHQALSDTVKAEKKIWLTSGFLSRHLERDINYNERNTGIGLELQLDDTSSISAGLYRNSVRERTHYLQYIWTPLSWGAVRFGAAAGMLDGYPELNDGKWALSLIPVVNVNFKLFGHDAGINLVYIPTIAEKVDGAFAVQLKVRVF